MTVIDAHQHVWDLARARYEWLTSDLSPINRTIDIAELRPSLVSAGVSATVLVQSADNAEDTQLMIDVAAMSPEVVAIVAWVPLENPTMVDARLAELTTNPLVAGVRALVHTYADAEWILRPDVSESLELVAARGLTFDLVGVLPRHLELVPELVVRHPDLRIVLDHLGHPPIGAEDREPWWAQIERAAESPSVYAKVSGLYSTRGNPASWTVDSIRPYIDRAYDVFGSDRLMYGGDWPISVLAGGYDRVWHGLSAVLDDLPGRERERVLAGTAADFYSIPIERIPE